MRRVNSSLSSDELLLEDLETEGERQLKSLLHHQLDTTVSIEQCKSKRRCFAPAAFYKPFGEEAAGALTLSQFQALQESNKETASLRELGLSDSEILLWKNRASTGKSSGLGAAPEATQDRLHAIQEKMEERQRILALPQRFAGSKQLSRREMEIENALFQGTDRHSFLRALYHQDDTQKKVTDEKDPMVHLESVYQELLSKKWPEEVQPTKSDPCLCPSPPPQGPVAEEPSLPDQEEQAEQARSPSLPATRPHQSPPRSVIIKEPVEFVPEEEICKNRLSEEELRNIPRFSSYHPGEPNKVLYLKNLGPRVTVKDLVSLFARFQKEDSPPIQFRLLSGRMRGQAFITFPDIQLAQDAMLLVNGYNLQGKPLVIEFGKSKGHSPEADSAIPCSSAGENPLAKNKDGKLELDFDTDEHDIEIADFLADNSEIPSRKAYCSILYLKPRMRVVLRQKVNTQLIAKSLANIEYDFYKPRFISKRVKITFGFTCKNKSHYGIMMYCNNWLIGSMRRWAVKGRERPDQTWVQREECLKWRKLPDQVDPTLLSEIWFCHLHSLPKYRDLDGERRRLSSSFGESVEQQVRQEGEDCRSQHKESLDA